MRNWERVQLKEVATINRDAVSPDSVSDDTPYVGLENIQRGGELVNVVGTGEAELESLKYRFSAKQVLFGKLRPYLAKIARPTFSGICSTDILPITPGERLDRDYLALILLSPEMVALAAARATGANLPRVSPTELSNIELPLPPLAEQRRIAEVLDKAVAVRTKRRKALAHLDELAQSIFLDMFGDPLAETSRFGRVALATLGRLDRGVSKHRPRNDPKLLGGPYPLIQTGDVARSAGYIENYEATYSELGLSQSKMWPRGTLCITIAANIAKGGILEFDACFPDSVVGFLADSDTTEFVRVWLSFLQQHLERMAPESAQKNINLAVLRTLMIPRPSDHMIAEFGARMRSVRTLQIAGQNHLRGSNALFEVLQYRAFRGEL